MHGATGHQHGNVVLKVVGYGDGTYGWLNTSNGFYGSKRYPTASEAQEAIDSLATAESGND